MKTLSRLLAVLLLSVPAVAQERIDLSFRPRVDAAQLRPDPRLAEFEEGLKALEARLEALVPG
ncbi:MAG: hypothetical protein HYV15_01615, partial [Elusimicrobia bacterium]|nr:hypothetical protein [Elusimicrobiota bacterium]